MGEIMNSPKGVKSGVPERVSISCPTCGTRHDLQQITGIAMLKLFVFKCNICNNIISSTAQIT